MARGQGPSRRRGAEALIVATREQIDAALTVGAATLVTAPGMAHAAGPAWFEAIVRARTAESPQMVFDVGDDAALGHSLCANGRHIVFTGAKRFRETLSATFPGQVWRGIARTGHLR